MVRWGNAEGREGDSHVVGVEGTRYRMIRIWQLADWNEIGSGGDLGA